jgi:galactitol-specific phosphotransferase system IIB component
MSNMFEEKIDEILAKRQPKVMMSSMAISEIVAAYDTAVAETLIEELEALAKMTESYEGKVQLLANLVERIYSRSRELRAQLSTKATK